MTTPTQYPPPPPGNIPAAPSPKKKTHKLRWTVLGIIGLIVIISIASNAGKNSSGSTTPSGTATPGVSHGLGSKDASADVALGGVTVDPVLKMPSLKVTVTNHSSKRSNYIIELSLETADGTRQIDTATVAVNNLEPGQSTVQTGQFTTAETLHNGSHVVVKSIDRLAAP